MLIGELDSLFQAIPKSLLMALMDLNLQTEFAELFLHAHSASMVLGRKLLVAIRISDRGNGTTILQTIDYLLSDTRISPKPSSK
jgi:hypothetical protein